jgi:hypothetical protein
MPTSVQASLLSLEEKRALGEVAADLAALRASILLITAKLDLDATVTDVNYASLCNPAATKLTP